MAIQKITIQEFLSLAKSHPVLDVRSPGEYNHAHISNAYSLPLFSDEERKVVGTAYKQENKQTAIKIGLDYFGGKMRGMVEEAEDIVARFSLVPLSTNEKTAIENQETKTVLVHCWRGGMRSAGVAWLLDLYGFTVYTLVGGYKAYRKWVRDQFEKPYLLTILGGYTGSGKTMILQQLKNNAALVIDLEALACHKGSAFGALAQKPQPSQEMFENILAATLSTLHFSNIKNLPIWMEDESQRIGRLMIPTAMWAQMRNSPIKFLEIPFEQRLDYLTEEYGKIETEKLVNAIIRIQKRLGGLETKNAISFLLEKNHRACFEILLHYYDKQYNKGLNSRENLNTLVNKIPFSKIDATAISAKLLQQEMV
jgi:tRNA 2-selenouridine synthase